MTVIDARPRVLAEQALSFARNGFLGLLSDMSSAMYHLGPLGETTECLGMDALAGDPQASGYPDRGAWCRLIHEEDRARVADAVLAARTNGALSALHYRIRRPDGAVRQVAEYMRAVATRRGPGTVGLILDVTDRLPSACRPKPRPAGPHRAALELAARQALARVVCDEAEVAFGGDCVAVTAHGSCRHDARASSMPTAPIRSR